MKIDPVFTIEAPEPARHYSQATKFNGMEVIAAL
jgi:enamine deaminase RidA (YjgF/YER057c/UK114 family)